MMACQRFGTLNLTLTPNPNPNLNANLNPSPITDPSHLTGLIRDEQQLRPHFREPWLHQALPDQPGARGKIARQWPKKINVDVMITISGHPLALSG